MGKRYLIDSNAVVGFQEGALSASGQSLFITIIDEEFNLSIINKIELLGYKNVSKATVELVVLATIFELDNAVSNATIEIRKKHKIKMPDAIIAATALVHDLIIVTRNTKDFAQISKIKTINPFDY